MHKRWNEPNYQAIVTVQTADGVNELARYTVDLVIARNQRALRAANDATVRDLEELAQRTGLSYRALLPDCPADPRAMMSFYGVTVSR